MLSKVIIAKLVIILTHQVKMKEWQTEDYSQRTNYCCHKSLYSSLFFSISLNFTLLLPKMAALFYSIDTR